VQANLMENPKVWPAMAAAIEKAQGDLAERMLQALEAGQKAGGDIRGQQSAAILIVDGKRPPASRGRTGSTTARRGFRDPIKELRRLVRLQHAYNLNPRATTSSPRRRCPRR
jgi:uncharacterized Ntn-hydrolase superfamily protein